MGVSTKSTPHIAVIGGGVTGVFAAYFLSVLDADVTIIERGEVGGAASGSNPGGLNPLVGAAIPGALHAFALESLRLHRESWAAIERLSAMPAAGNLASRLYVAMDESDAGALESVRERYDSTPGYSACWLDRFDLRREHPLVTSAAVGALWTEGNLTVRPLPYVQAVAAASVKLGTRILQAEASGLRSLGGRVTHVIVGSEEMRCDGVVLATGPWCDSPSEWLGIPLPVEPVKGELILVKVTGRRLAGDVTWREAGIYTAGADMFWLGGVEDRVGYDSAPTPAARNRIFAGVRQLLPEFDPIAELRHVAGLRPTTPDNLPIAGIPSGWENVCLALGSGRKGMLLGAGLGRAAAEVLLGRRTTASIDRFSPSRRVPQPQRI